MDDLNTDMEEWAVAAKQTCKWFIDTIGNDAWALRRRKVVEYFKKIDEQLYTEQELRAKGGFQANQNPIAVYADWMAWYLYLVESLKERPGCDDPMQSGRIYPAFASIGRNIEALKKMKGIDNRLQDMLNEKQNQPDSTLFELLIAALYHQNGYEVEFLAERPGMKMPDMRASKDGKSFLVECKRLAKVTDFSEKERQNWVKRFDALAQIMRMVGKPAFVEVVFKVPVEEVEIDFLPKLFMDYVRVGGLNYNQLFSTPKLDFKARHIDLEKINKRLAHTMARANSPQMIELMAGSYDMHGSYTMLAGPSEVTSYGPDDDLHVLNKFYGGLHEAYIAKWECIDESSINAKAKDVKKILSKAVSQMSDTEPGRIHIGYETVNGPLVEFMRHKKVNEAIESFRFDDKNIHSIYCHAMQPLIKIEEFECAETVISFENEPRLEKKLILERSGFGHSNGTHWHEDFFDVRSI
jgi:hypothetical protein